MISWLLYWLRLHNNRLAIILSEYPLAIIAEAHLTLKEVLFVN